MRALIVWLLPAVALAQGVQRGPVPAIQRGPIPAISPWAVSPVKLSIRFDAPGCYASGAAVGTRGEKITFARAGTKACTGVGTCQANQLCVTASGAELGTGEVLSVVNPLRAETRNFCVAATASSSGSGPIAAGTGTAADAGAWTLYFVGTTTARLFTVDAAAAWKAGQQAVANLTTARRYVGCATGDGFLSMAVNGTGPGTIDAGSGGTGIIGAQRATIYLGNNASFAVPVAVTLKGFKVCASSNPAHCGP